MTEPRGTTHDWAHELDLDHLALIRADPAGFAPGGTPHLVLEVLAYAADEAAANGGGNCAVTLWPDGSVMVSDSGRGTETRLDAHGRPVRKPVMATRDLRFFDLPDAPPLPDGRPRRGMSVVAALSEWLIHTNRRIDGAWTQRYEHGVPVTDLLPITATGHGTTVHFRPHGTVRSAGLPTVAELNRLVRAWPWLAVRTREIPAG